MHKTLLYAVIFIIGFIGVSLWSFWIVIRPPKIILKSTPADFSLPAEDVTLTSEDGLKLSAWLIESPTQKKHAVILLHGYPAEKADMLSIARVLYPDFTLLLPDLRYFGKSEGSYTTLGIKELLDTETAIHFLGSRGYEKVGIFGFSLGGAVGLLTAAEDSQVSAVGAYATFSDLRLLGHETYSNLFILKYPLVELMILWSKLFFGTAITEVSPIDAVQKITVPVFLIHTKEDDQISFSHAERLQNALKHNKKAEFYFPEKGLHGELPLDFYDRLKDFFNRSL